MRRRLYLLLTLLLLVISAFPVRAQAQEIRFQNVEVLVWPEYDRERSVLVIYRITLGGDVKLPAEITLPMPAAAKTPHAVAEQNENGLFNVDYTLSSVQNNMIWVTFLATVPQIHLEYYDPTLEVSDTSRVYRFRYLMPYPTDNLVLEIQRPRTATALTLDPPGGTSQQGTDGLTYYGVVVGEVKANLPVNLKITYQKSDDELTQPNTFEPVAPAEAVSESTPGKLNFTEVIPWAVGALGLVMVIAAGWMFLQARKESEETPMKRHKPSRTAKPDSSGNEALYCPQCGKRAAPGDLFCRSCGTRLPRG